MSDWRPDWRDKESYGFADTTSNEQWAWEFLRRSPLYESAWNDYQRSGVIASAHELRTRFGVGGLCNPAETWTEDLGCGLSFEQFCYNKIVTWRHHPERFDGDGPLRMSIGEFNEATRPNYPHEVVVKIDLRFSIESQLAMLKIQLPLHRELTEWLYEGTVAQNGFSIERKRTETYPKYLRLLDAEVQATSTSTHDLLVQVGKQFASEDGTGYDDDVRRALQDNLEAAWKMRDFGYRTLNHVSQLKGTSKQTSNRKPQVGSG